MATQNEESTAAASSDELFSDACIPALLPNETVYSWCARFHQLNCGWNPRETSRLLFGHPSAGLKHDIPVRMGAFQQRTRGELGDVEQLIRNRTLFGFHAPFLSMEDEQEVLKHLLSGENNGVLEKLSVKRAGIAEVNPLKLCPECVREQTTDIGYAWWRIEQQLPSAFICKTHGEWLQVAAAKQRRGAFQDFHVPLERHELKSLKLGNTTLDEKEHLIRVGDWGNYVFGNRNLRLTDTTLRHCYLHQAKARGWLTFEGTVRLQQLRDAFIAQQHNILRYFDSEFFGDLNGVNAGFLAYLLRQLPGRRHPLKHLLLMNLLFETTGELLEVSKKMRATYANGGEPAVKKMLCEGREQLHRLVIDEGRSVSRAAATVGISTTSASKHLHKQGIELRDKRPRIVGTEKEKQLRQMLLKGAGRKEISLAVGVRAAFIKDYLATQPELKTHWNTAHRKQQKDKHRDQLLAALRENPSLPIKAIRRLPGNGFQWLYVNDHEWLHAVLPAIWKR